MIFKPICREIFTLSFEIMVILDWTSPLRGRTNHRVEPRGKRLLDRISPNHF